MTVRLNRRELSASIAAAAAVGVSSGVARAAEGGKTIALMFDAFDSDFWITGNVILKAKAKETAGRHSRLSRTATRTNRTTSLRRWSSARSTESS